MSGTTSTYVPKKLGDLLGGVDHQVSARKTEVIVSGISSDSRQIEPGYLFIAVAGLVTDGHQYIREAISGGCVAVVAERKRLPPELTATSAHIVFITVDDSRKALGNIAAAFFNHPAESLKLIGVTGTNGKTTVTYLVEAMLKNTGIRPGVIGTVNYHYTDTDGELISTAAPFTTPEPIVLQQLLREMADHGVTHVAMEVSSHALAQERLAGLLFDIGVFTNLTRDHLDFHGDMEQYFASKKKLFSHHLKMDGQAIIVLSRNSLAYPDNQALPEDRDWGELLVTQLQHEARETSCQSNHAGTTVARRIKITTCGLDSRADTHPSHFTFDLQGISAEINTAAGDFTVQSPLVGEFNLKNILAATAVGVALGLNGNLFSDALSRLDCIPGRLERIRSAARKNDSGATVFVDYAHTPDALENVLKTLKHLRPARLICLFGCGGDRDRGKRPLMGAIAGKYCDVVLLTSDNPRSEKPEKIIAEIEAGLAVSPLSRGDCETLLRQNLPGYDIIVSRRQAIETAIRHAHHGDVVLISGKGHEDYQVVSTGRIFFDDRLEARMQLDALQ